MKYHIPTFSFQWIKIYTNTKVFQKLTFNIFKNKCHVYLKLLTLAYGPIREIYLKIHMTIWGSNSILLHYNKTQCTIFSAV